MMPLASVVFPLPRSPLISTSTGAESFAAISLPLAMVSSAERVINSLAAMFPLGHHSRIGCRNRFDQVRGDERRFANARRGDIARQAVQINPKAQHARPILGAELRG